MIEPAARARGAEPGHGAAVSGSAPRRRSFLPLLLWALAAVYVFWDAGRPFNETDDFWSAEIVTEMLRSGDLAVPRFAGRPDFNKPPLFYWASLPAAAVLPDLEAAMRVVPGLAFCLLLLLVYREIARRCGSGTALTAAAILALTYDHLHVHGFRSAVPDGLLTLEISGVLFLALRRRERPWLLLPMGALVGAAFMTKTALAVVPATLVVASLWIERREAPVRAGHAVAGAALGLAVVLPWFALAIAREGTGLLDQMFLDQVWKRFVNSPVAVETGRVFGRSEPLYVLRHYLTWAQPWSLLAGPAFVRLWLRRGALSSAELHLVRLCAIWFALVLGLMSASHAAWAWYAASAHVPAAVACALALREFARAGELRDGWLWAPLVASLLWLDVPLAYDPYVETSGRLPLDPSLAHQLLVAGLLLGLVLVFARLVRVPHPASPRLAAALPALLAAGLVLHLSGRAAGAQVLQLGALGLGVALALRFDGPAARRAGLASLAVLAVSYLAAPLAHAGGSAGRQDIREVRALLDAGFFDGGRVWLRRARLYSYVRLHQEFADELDVRYDAERQLLSLQRPAVRAP